MLLLFCVAGYNQMYVHNTLEAHSKQISPSSPCRISKHLYTNFSRRLVEHKLITQTYSNFASRKCARRQSNHLRKVLIDLCIFNNGNTDFPNDAHCRQRIASMSMLVRFCSAITANTFTRIRNGKFASKTNLFHTFYYIY